MVINQYDIVLVNLDPTLGSEMNKKRPCVIISPNEMNRNLQTTVIAPMTSSIKNYPTRVDIIFEGKNGSIVLDQIRTIDKKRIVKTLDKLSKSEFQKVKAVIKEIFVD